MNKPLFDANAHADDTATCAEVIANFVVHSPNTHPEEVWAHAKRAFADTIGCMYLGADHPDTQAVLTTVQSWGTGDSKVYGRPEKLPAPWAALVNGTSAHAYDFDDWEDPGITHTSAAIYPALLAITDDAVSLEAIWDAWIVGVEVLMRIGEAVNMTHYELGWHTTNTLAAIGAAAACARLMSLNETETSHAVSVSTSMIGGFTSQFGTTAKPLHAGLAAKTGILSASFAANNVTAQKAVFESDAGFLKAMTRASPDDLRGSLAHLGQTYAMLRYGLHIKNYPSCGATHLVIEACQNLRNRHQMKPSDVVGVETVISDIARSVLPYGVPKDRTEALFSVPWCATVALIDGDVGVASFQPDALSRSDLLDLAARVSVNEHPRSPGLAFHPDFPDAVTVHLKDGQSFSDRIAYPIGSPKRPLPHDDLRRKFLDNAQHGGLSKDVAEGLFETIFEASPKNVLGDLFVN